jgi:hypothetical protein
MRVSCLAPAASFLLLAPLFVSAQQAPQRDPQAFAVLQRAVTAMGGLVPSDSVATGNVVLVEGSKTENGTIRFLTRGLDQSAEYMQVPTGLRSVVYSRGRASDERSAKPLQLELAVTSQSSAFPLQLAASALSDPDAAFVYVGLENLEGQQVHHIRFWKTFASNPKLQSLAEVSKRDIWIDAASNLPRKLSYKRRASRGPGAVGILIEVSYSDYRNVSGVLYPYRIERFVNGTLWAAITFQNVVFNSGLTGTDFSSP